jgi:hypothetical protein
MHQNRQFQKINKLFYDLYPYKISCKAKGITLIRYKSIDNVFNTFINVIPDEKYPSSFTFYKDVNKFELGIFLNLSRQFIEDKTIRKRIERNRIDFYVLTKEKYNEIMSDLARYVNSYCEPANQTELEKLLSDKKYIFCKNLPHKKYKFKISFKDMPLQVRNDLINWASKYNDDDIFITPSTKIHFTGTKFKYGPHYFYIKDQKMINFVSLAASGYIKRIDEYITRDLA